MAKCEECLHHDVCEALERGNGIQKLPPSLCSHFKNNNELAMDEKKHVKWEEPQVLCPLMVASARGTQLCGKDRCAWWISGVRGKCAIKEIAEYIGCEARGAGTE